MITTVAPAKINLTLEVLGKRDDGYHEIRSVMQAIDLHDEITLESPADSELRVSGTGVPPDDDLVLRAARALDRRGAHIRVRKRIPAGAGLGGGSSDAAATLRGLSCLKDLGRPVEDLADVGAGLGSDVPFFLYGGTAMVEGRGDQVTPLPDAPATWLVILVPPASIEGKTRRMYGALHAEHWSSGSRATALAGRLRAGGTIEEGMLYNCFEAVALEVFPGLRKYQEWMMDAGARSVHLCGAGPALFALASGESEARAMRGRMTRPKMGEGVHVCRTITAAESTLVWET